MSYREFSDKACTIFGRRVCGILNHTRDNLIVLIALFGAVITIDCLDVLFYFLQFLSYGFIFVGIVGNLVDLAAFVIVLSMCGPIAITGFIEFFDVLLLVGGLFGMGIIILLELVPVWVIIVIVWYVIKRFNG